MKNVLFLCTGNSARSIMAEAYLNHAGGADWRAYSAGSNPAGKPNAFALEILSTHGVPAIGARSKSWDEFTGEAAPLMAAVVTVCDNAASKTCPLWPRRGALAATLLHWNFPDPAAVAGDDDVKRAAFEQVFSGIRAKIDGFCAGAIT